MTEHESIRTEIRYYKARFATIPRFRGWHRVYQKRYLDMRTSQMDKIIELANECPSAIDSDEQKILYYKIRRDYLSKKVIFDALDRLDYNDRWELGNLPPGQTTLDKWTVSIYIEESGRDI